MTRRDPIGVLVVLLLLATQPAAAEVTPVGRASLSRFHDPVIVSTARLQLLHDRSTSNLRLYALRAGKLEAIPYQFDAFDRKHQLQVSHGQIPRSFEFDGNDELVFMAKDAGDQTPSDSFPPRTDSVLEIQLNDPVNAGKAWVYLLHFSGPPPPRSNLVYTNYDTKTDIASGTFYSIEYFPGGNFFTGMRFTEAAGGTGENILHRMKVRLNPTFKGGWSPVFKEDDFSAIVEGVKNGPVRSIRRVRQALNLGPLLPSPGGTVHTYYYFSSFVTPSIFSIPWLVMKMARDFRFYGVSDFNHGVIGMTYWDSANPDGLTLTGNNTEHVNATSDHDWWALGGSFGSCVHIFLLPKELTDLGVVRGTVFRDDDAATDPTDADPTVGVHSVGYSLLNVIEAGASGEFETTLSTVFLKDPYRPGDEAGALAMLKQPLESSITRLVRTKSGFARESHPRRIPPRQVGYLRPHMNDLADAGRDSSERATIR